MQVPYWSGHNHISTDWKGLSVTIWTNRITNSPASWRSTLKAASHLIWKTLLLIVWVRLEKPLHFICKILSHSKMTHNMTITRMTLGQLISVSKPLYLQKLTLRLKAPGAGLTISIKMSNIPIIQTLIILKIRTLSSNSTTASILIWE